LVTLPQVSLAVTLKVTLLVHWPAAALTMMVGRTGDYRTLDVTNDHSLLAGGAVALPSVAVQVTRLVPHRELCRRAAGHGYPPQLSLAVGLPNATPVARHGSSNGINGYVRRTCDCRKLSISER